jgi:Flp pilus assembly protein TadB
LNDSIAKLDEILDGLSQAIPATIRDTLRESVAAAVTEGVRIALVEIFTSGDLLNLMHGLVPSPAPALIPADPVGPSLKDRIGATLSRAGRWVGTRLRGLTRLVASGLGSAHGRVVGLMQRCRLLWTLRRPLAVAAGVGCAAAVVALVAPNWLVAAVSGVGGAVGALGTQLWLWTRRACRALGGVNA